MVAPPGLKTYRAMRDFAVSPEPSGEEGAARGRRFVVQKHAATRLHYDFRLEWGGVLLSWAVTRGPSADPTAKRLAVRTEDHPVDYADFEGVIPPKQYGAGVVMLWDSGTWAPLDDAATGLVEGKLKFTLAGVRMRGAWMLVRIKPREREKRENWLLIKERDADAAPGPDALVDAYATSIATGRDMAGIAAGAPVARKRRRRDTAALLPSFRLPQLARLDAAAPDSDGWVHEVKFDGYRCLAAVAGGRVRLHTRTGLDWTDRFGALTADFARLACRSALIDGEVTAPGAAAGAFAALQARLEGGGALLFVAFDLLELDGADLTGEPLIARKARLERLLGASGAGAIRFSTHVEGRGAEAFAHVCSAGQEGLVSKLANSAYHSGRHSSWRKVKCGRRQEFVIGGWSPSTARGRPFASLLMGTYQAGVLRYRGRVGTGFGEREFADLAPRLAALAQEAAPFDAVPRLVAGARWVRPELAAEVGFAGLTGEGLIRHGVYRGLRADKPVAEIVMEGEVADTVTAVRDTGAAEPTQGDGAAPVVKGQRISSPERRVFETPPVTKLQVAEHYAVLAERILPFAARRPLSLLRCPDGVAAACFFQKHRGQGMPKAIGSVRVVEAKGGEADYISLSSAGGLVGAAQMGTIEFHIWGARNDRLDTPDRLVFDLDPDEGLAFAKVRAAAVEMRDRLDALGLPSIPMLTGGKGVHVIVPLRPKAGWETVKLFSRTLAAMMADEAPRRFTATMAKSQRTGRIFIDWLRNERGATAVAPYSLRARPGASVATPIAWDELARIRSAGAFDIVTVRDRLGAPCPLREAGKRAVMLGASVITRLERGGR